MLKLAACYIDTTNQTQSTQKNNKSNKHSRLFLNISAIPFAQLQNNQA